MAEAAQKDIKVTLVRSTIGSIPKHRKTIKALGLGKIGSTKIFHDNDAVRGMVNQVRHLIKVEEI